MKGLGIERNLGQGITLKRRSGPKRIDIERYMILEKKKRWVIPTSQGPRRNGKYLPVKGPGNGQDGNGGDEGRDDKKKFRNTEYDFED